MEKYRVSKPGKSAWSQGSMETRTNLWILVHSFTFVGAMTKAVVKIYIILEL
jgi:hypothetical protein